MEQIGAVQRSSTMPKSSVTRFAVSTACPSAMLRGYKSFRWLWVRAARKIREQERCSQVTYGDLVTFDLDLQPELPFKTYLSKGRRRLITKATSFSVLLAPKANVARLHCLLRAKGVSNLPSKGLGNLN